MKLLTATATTATALLAALAAAAANFNPNPNEWTFKGGMLSIPRWQIAATSVASKALFAGGRLDSGSYVDNVDVYDNQSDSWSTAKLSIVRSEIGAGSFNGRYALFAGGFDNQFRTLDIVDVYDAQEDKWSTVKLTQPRAGPRVIDLGDRAAIVGGLTSDWNYLSKAVDYIDSDLKVTAGSDMPVGYPQFGIVASNPDAGFGVMTAGYQNNKPGERFNQFEASNQTTIFTRDGAEKAGPVFPSPRYGAGIAHANGRFVVGGGTESTNSGRVDILCEDSLSWCGTLQLPTPRAYPNTAALGNRYIVFAGGDNVKEFDILDTSTSKWVPHKPNLQLYSMRSGAASAVIDDCVLLVGGGNVYNGQNSTASVEIFNACV